MTSPSSNPNLSVVRHSVSDFRAENRTDFRFFIHGRIVGGLLSFVVVARLTTGERGTVSGKDFFAAMMAHFGAANVNTVKGNWIKGIDLDTNIDEFNRLTAAGVPDEDAAKQTWTAAGRRNTGSRKPPSSGRLGRRGTTMR
jgi:hypothetical protein